MKDTVVELDRAKTIYLLDCQAENKSNHTTRWYDSKLGLFLGWVGEQHSVTRITDLEPAHIKDFLRALRERRGRRGSMSSLTVRGYAQVVQTFCHWLVAEGYRESDPWGNIAMPKVEKYQVQAFSAADIDAMLDAVARKPRHGRRDYAIIYLLYDTAIRASELLKLTLGDVDWQASQLMIHGKGDKMRTVPMGRQAHRALARYVHEARPEPLLPDTNEVFLNERGEPLTLSGLWRLVRLAATKAGVTGKRLSPHTIRHAGAEDFLRNGGDAFSLQKLLGHTTLNVTRTYVDLVNADVQNAHRRASPGDNLRRRRKR